MTNLPPDYCGYRGSELTVAGLAPGAYRCERCEQYVFHSLTPGAAVTVVDEDSLLLVQRAIGESAGRWETLAGHIDWGERPLHAAARELRLVAGLSAWPAESKHMVGFEYVVHRDATRGESDAGSNAQDAHFSTAGEWRRVDEIVAETLAELD